MLLCSAGGGGQCVMEKTSRALACRDVHLQRRLVCKHIVMLPECTPRCRTFDGECFEKIRAPGAPRLFPATWRASNMDARGKRPHHSSTLTPSQHGRPANQRTDITAYIWSCATTPALCCAWIRLCVAGGASFQTGASARLGRCTSTRVIRRRLLSALLTAEIPLVTEYPPSYIYCHSPLYLFI